VHTWSLDGQGGGGKRRHAPHPLVFTGYQLRAAAERTVRDTFQAAAGSIPQDVSVIIETPEGAPGEVLTRISGEPGSLLVVGTGHKSRWRRKSRSPVARYCIEHGTCPVVVIPGPAD
jgi:nucleotide-binding universal stress UspA family protein